MKEKLKRRLREREKGRRVKERRGKGRSHRLIERKRGRESQKAAVEMR